MQTAFMNMISAHPVSETQKTIFTAAAFSIGTELCRTAIWHKDKCNWIGRNTNPLTRQEYFESLGTGFYSGTSGIAFFLLHLYNATNENIFLQVATGAIKHSVDHATFTSKESFSFYDGNAGIIYSLLDRYDLTKESLFLEKANELLNKLAEQNIPDVETDVISGAAGCIPLLLYSSLATDDKKYLEKAIDLGNFLLAKSISEDTGCSWQTLDNCSRNLTGFSHGCAGIGLSLLLLYSKTGELKFKSAAENAFAYEDSFFNEKILNWPDFRKDSEISENGLAYFNGWCHGASGIGLSRLLAYTLLKDEKLISLSENVVHSVTNNLNSCDNYSLCHGFFGNAEFPLLFGRITNQPELILKTQLEIETRTGNILQNGKVWKCGTVSRNESPGFMMGISGIGNFLLRLAGNFKYESGLYIEKLFPIPASSKAQ